MDAITIWEIMGNLQKGALKVVAEVAQRTPPGQAVHCYWEDEVRRSLLGLRTEVQSLWLTTIMPTDGSLPLQLYRLSDAGLVVLHREYQEGKDGYIVTAALTARGWDVYRFGARLDAGAAAHHPAVPDPAARPFLDHGVLGLLTAISATGDAGADPGIATRYPNGARQRLEDLAYIELQPVTWERPSNFVLTRAGRERLHTERPDLTGEIPQ